MEVEKVMPEKPPLHPYDYFDPRVLVRETSRNWKKPDKKAGTEPVASETTEPGGTDPSKNEEP